jgi:NADH-quinone oxidoreductase subunit G
LQRTPSICAGCALGCNIELHARDGQILRMWGRDNPAVNEGWLSDHDRFDTLPLLRDQRPTGPLVRQGGTLQPASWDAAYAHVAELLKGAGAGVLLSPDLTNEAIWLAADALRAAAPGVSVGFSPQAIPSWTLTGKVAEIPRAKTVVLVGFDPWTEISGLALWLRKAVLNGGTMLAIGPDNGLYRDTAHWLRAPAGDEIGIVEKLLAAKERGGEIDQNAAIHGRRANRGVTPTDAAIAAAAAAVGAGPVVFLVGARLADDPSARPVLEKLAAALGASTESGMLGSPSTTVNGRGALDLAGDVVAADRAAGSTAARAQAGELSAVLVLGGETLPATGSARKVVVTHGRVPEDDLTDPTIDVVLPVAHPYEQAGSFTNLEGRVQALQAGGLPPHGVPSDWLLVAGLIERLGGSAPKDLAVIRAALAEAHPSYKLPDGRTGRVGRLALPVA